MSECLFHVRDQEDIQDEEEDGGLQRPWLSCLELVKAFTASPPLNFLSWLHLWSSLPTIEKGKREKKGRERERVSERREEIQLVCVFMISFKNNNIAYFINHNKYTHIASYINNDKSSIKLYKHKSNIHTHTYTHTHTKAQKVDLSTKRLTNDTILSLNVTNTAKIGKEFVQKCYKFHSVCCNLSPFSCSLLFKEET